MTDLTPYSVVRDARGHLCLIDDGHVTYMGERLDEIEEARSLPVTPILDRDGLPVVRTVGDLTLRHQLAHPNIRVKHPVPHSDDEWQSGTLRVAKLSDIGRGLITIIWGHWWVDCPVDTPCEVLS